MKRVSLIFFSILFSVMTLNASKVDFLRYELHEATLSGDLDGVKKAIKSGIKVNSKDGWGNAALHYVTTVEIAEYLIKKGANVNEKNSQGDVPLHHSRSAKIAKFLIKKGGDVKAANNDGELPIHTVIYIYMESLAVIKLFIKHGVDINARNDSGETVLSKVEKKIEVYEKTGGDLMKDAINLLKKLKKELVRLGAKN